MDRQLSREVSQTQLTGTAERERSQTRGGEGKSWEDEKVKKRGEEKRGVGEADPEGIETC